MRGSQTANSVYDLANSKIDSLNAVFNPHNLRYNFVMSTTHLPPLVYRAMLRWDDGHPVVGHEANKLGVRPGVDIHTDDAGLTMLDGSGMSVSPGWRQLPVFRIPKRLRGLFPGAAGADTTSCFRMGSGPFEREEITTRLELIPDEGRPPVKHGVIAPTSIVLLPDYQSDLASTRTAWEIDES